MLCISDQPTQSHGVPIHGEDVPWDSFGKWKADQLQRDDLVKDLLLLSETKKRNVRCMRAIQDSMPARFDAPLIIEMMLVELRCISSNDILGTLLS